MKKLQTEIDHKKRKTGTLTLVLLCLIFVALSVVKIFVANKLVEYSEKLRHLENTESTLKQERELLSIQLSGVTSLAFLSEKAKERGFVAPSQVVLVKTPSPLAVKWP